MTWQVSRQFKESSADTSPRCACKLFETSRYGPLLITFGCSYGHKWVNKFPQPSVLDIGSYLCLLLLSFPWLLWKSHQISISFSFATWQIQSFLWPLPARLSWYLSRERSSGFTSSCAASDVINLLVTSAANCTAFSFLSSSRFRGGMLCCLCLLASLTFTVARATDGLCWSLLLDTCDNWLSLFSISAQLRSSLFDYECRYQVRSRYTAALDVIWTWYLPQPTHAPSVELEAANSKGNSRQLFQIVKSMTWKFQPRLQCIQSATGENLTEAAQIADRWKGQNAQNTWRYGKLVSGQRNGRSPHSSHLPRKVILNSVQITEQLLLSPTQAKSFFGSY